MFDGGCEETQDDEEGARDDDRLVAGLQRVVEHDPDQAPQSHFCVMS